MLLTTKEITDIEFYCEEYFTNYHHNGLNAKHAVDTLEFRSILRRELGKTSVENFSLKLYQGEHPSESLLGKVFSETFRETGVDIKYFLDIKKTPVEIYFENQKFMIRSFNAPSEKICSLDFLEFSTVSKTRLFADEIKKLKQDNMALMYARAAEDSHQKTYEVCIKKNREISSSQGLCLISPWSTVKSVVDAVWQWGSKKANNYVQDVVQQCPSYFPNSRTNIQKFYWGTKNNTFFRNQSGALNSSSVVVPRLGP